MTRRPVKLKRVYEPPSKADGMRVLVDRLWPRGLRKQDVLADLWLREVAPSRELRRWYGHDLRRWSQFRRKYRSELVSRAEILTLLNDLRRRSPVTLLFGARDVAHSHAAVLRRVLETKTTRKAKNR
jgi:uncharacterized protein YeaO (DUF488 family)